jgi:hypothetical protein
MTRLVLVGTLTGGHYPACASQTRPRLIQPAVSTLLAPLEDRDKTIGLESMRAGGGRGMTLGAGRTCPQRPGSVGLDGRDG